MTHKLDRREYRTIGICGLILDADHIVESLQLSVITASVGPRGLGIYDSRVQGHLRVLGFVKRA